MRKIAKLIAVAAFFMPVVMAFAGNEIPTDIDSLFRGREFQLPSLDSSYRTNSSAVPQAKNSGKEQESVYTLQFAIVDGFDKAMNMKARLQAQTGYDIDMKHEGTMYKLTGGIFRKKSDAEDKARELSMQNISAHAVRLR
ncbi:MAG: SPOR domain-containing protein [Fibromonadales bacterium]|nr:SPOR domain-containing protein [Fibromonadales bacterium]